MINNFICKLQLHANHKTDYLTNVNMDVVMSSELLVHLWYIFNWRKISDYCYANLPSVQWWYSKVFINYFIWGSLVLSLAFWMFCLVMSCRLNASPQSCGPVIFDRDFLPVVFGKSRSSCKASDATWSAPGNLFSRYPPNLVFPYLQSGEVPDGGRWTRHIKNEAWRLIFYGTEFMAV